MDKDKFVNPCWNVQTTSDVDAINMKWSQDLVEHEDTSVTTSCETKMPLLVNTKLIKKGCQLLMTKQVKTEDTKKVTPIEIVKPAKKKLKPSM